MSKYRKLPKIPGFTRDQLIQFFKVKLMVNETWRMRALEVLISKQTPYEYAHYKTCIHNNQGFSASHAPVMTSIWKYYKLNKEVTNYQYMYLKDVLPMYAEQMIMYSDVNKMEPMIKKFYMKC